MSYDDWQAWQSGMVVVGFFAAIVAGIWFAVVVKNPPGIASIPEGVRRVGSGCVVSFGALMLVVIVCVAVSSSFPEYDQRGESGSGTDRSESAHEYRCMSECADAYDHCMMGVAPLDGGSQTACRQQESACNANCFDLQR